MLSPNNLVSSTSAYSSHSRNRDIILKSPHMFVYGTTDPNPASSVWPSNTTSSHPASLSSLLNPSTQNSSSYPRGAFRPGKMSYPSPFVHGPGQDSPDSQQNTGYSATSAYDKIASAPHDYSRRYPSPYSAVSPGPLRPRPLRLVNSGVSGQPGLLGARRARRPHPYRDMVNRPEDQTRDMGPQLSTSPVTTTRSPSPVNAGGSNSVVSINHWEELFLELTQPS